MAIPAPRAIHSPPETSPRAADSQVGHDLCQRSNDHEDDDGCEQI
jgi:hypothetical protein